MNKSISNDDIKSLCKEFGYDPLVVKAVILVEASNRGFDPVTGKILIQFEPGHFKRAKIENGVDVQRVEWEAYEKAYAINADEAMKATSWGMGQIMGFNHKLAGYESVGKMVNEFKISEYYQVRGMLRFISNNPNLVKAIRTKDWRLFAKHYNGANYEKFNYHTRLEAAYKKVTKHV